mgnify:CR=1 FL=1
MNYQLLIESYSFGTSLSEQEIELLSLELETQIMNINISTEFVCFKSAPSHICEGLNIKKDTSILMIEEAINNKFNVFQCEINDLFVEDGNVHASARNIISAGSTQVEGITKEDINVVDFKLCFMRKDPPVDENYVNALHLLGLAEKKGAVIYNKPNAIKEFNEKIFAIHFQEYIPKTLISSKISKIEKFYHCLLYTSPSPRDVEESRMPSSA